MSKEDEDILMGKDVETVRPAKLSDAPPEVQKELRYQIRLWRLNQLMWGWCWCAAFDIFMRHIVADDRGVWWCVLFALMCGLGRYYGTRIKTPVFVLKR